MATGSAAPCDAQLAAHTSGRGERSGVALLACSILGSSLAFIDGSVVNVALPAIGHGLGAAPASLGWAINAYLLPLGALILLGGAAGDRFGRRRLFVGGVGVFLAASVLCALAASFPMLLAGRILQGIGAAVLMPNSLALLGAGFEGEAKGRAIGTWAGVGALKSATGPLIGGWLVQGFGWRSIFLLNLPVGAAAIVLALGFVAESRDRNARASLDWTGAALVTAGLALLTWGLTASAVPDAQAAPVIGAVIAGLVLLGVFVGVEIRRGAAALMPIHLLASRSFLGVTLLTLLLYAALGGLIVILPYLLIRIEHYTPVAAGAAVLPIPLMIGLGSRLMGQMTARIGGRLPLAAGALLVGVGLALYCRIGTGDAAYWTMVFPATAVVALGMAVSVAPLTTTVMISVDADHVGSASGFNSAVARIGGLVATALLGFVLARSDDAPGFVAGFHAAMVAGTLLCLGASVSAFLLIAERDRA